MSIREQIAHKRAEQQKSLTAGGLNELGSLEDALPSCGAEEEDVQQLGRWSTRETIEKGRSTGDLSFSSSAASSYPARFAFY